MRDEEPIDPLLEGWGGPPPAPDFADRVVARVARPTRRRVAVAFALGAAIGGLAVGAVAVVDAVPSGASRAELDAPTHVAFPGVADVVAEPGARLQWSRRGDGEIVVELERGVAWVRRTGPGFAVIADGDAIDLASPCARVEVDRGFLRVDVTDDTVDCGRVEDAIARAEPSRSGSR